MLVTSFGGFTIPSATSESFSQVSVTLTLHVIPRSFLFTTYCDHLPQTGCKVAHIDLAVWLEIHEMKSLKYSPLVSELTSISKVMKFMFSLRQIVHKSVQADLKPCLYKTVSKYSNDFDTP